MQRYSTRFPTILLCAALLLAQRGRAEVVTDTIGASDIQGVRLAGGPSPRQGRLEIQAGGAWRPFCQWSTAGTNVNRDGAPRVACRQLGFGWGAEYDGGSGGRDQSAHMVGQLECQGAEAALQDCDMLVQFLDEPCGSTSEDSEEWTVWAACHGAVAIEELRLANGSAPGEGRVEIRVGQKWGTLCGAEPWQYERNDLLAAVVCRQLGFDASTPPLVREAGLFGGSRPPPLADALECSGEEADLNGCILASPADHACRGPAFGVACNGSAMPAAARLAGGASDEDGLLEVQLRPGGEWQGVCSTDEAEFAQVAHVVCRQLDKKGGAVQSFDAGAADALPPPVLASVRCTGNETTLAQCSFGAPTEDDRKLSCSFPQGIACSGAQSIRSVRLADGFTPNEGRLEIQNRAAQWDQASSETSSSSGLARVACRQLGLGGGAVRLGFYNAGELPGAVASFVCAGDEASLSQCSFAFDTDTFGSDMGIACNGSKTIQDLRLVNASAPAGSPVLGGFLQAKVGDPLADWGLVCAPLPDPDPATAAALCRELGHSGEGAEVTAGVAPIDEPEALGLPVLDGIHCSADVESLEACALLAAFDTSTPDAPDAGPCGPYSAGPLAVRCQPLPAPPGRPDTPGGGLSEGHRR